MTDKIHPAIEAVALVLEKFDLGESPTLDDWRDCAKSAIAAFLDATREPSEYQARVATDEIEELIGWEDPSAEDVADCITKSICAARIQLRKEILNDRC